MDDANHRNVFIRLNQWALKNVVECVGVTLQVIYPSIHPSSFRLSGVGSWGQQPKQGNPDFPLHSHFVQLFLGDLKAFPGQLRDLWRISTSTVWHGMVWFGSVSIKTEYHIVPPRHGRGRHNTAARNCLDVIYTAPSHTQNRKTNNNNISNTTMEDTEAIVYLLLTLWLFATHKAKEESQRRLQAARQNTVEKHRRVLEAIRQNEALNERTRAAKRQRLRV